jgi:hypothetical protein
MFDYAPCGCICQRTMFALDIRKVDLNHRFNAGRQDKYTWRHQLVVVAVIPA